MGYITEICLLKRAASQLQTSLHITAPQPSYYSSKNEGYSISVGYLEGKTIEEQLIYRTGKTEIPDTLTP